MRWTKKGSWPPQIGGACCAPCHLGSSKLTQETTVGILGSDANRARKTHRPTAFSKPCSDKGRQLMMHTSSESASATWTSHSVLMFAGKKDPIEAIEHRARAASFSERWTWDGTGRHTIQFDSQTCWASQ